MSKFGLHLIKNPAGTFSFVGSVPLRLAYLSKAGDFVTGEEVERQMRLPASHRTIKSRTFLSRESAVAAAKLIGCSFSETKENENE